MFSPKPLSYYRDLTLGGEFKIDLTQEEACVALKVYDYGVEALSNDEQQILYRFIGKLKDEIWP